MAKIQNSRIILLQLNFRDLNSSSSSFIKLLYAKHKNIILLETIIKWVSCSEKYFTRDFHHYLCKYYGKYIRVLKIFFTVQICLRIITKK